jgi:signal transduction histidine kinase/ligand-binding sensor domain-containing protein/DNA-binding response OmpR family regulator
MKKIFIIKGLVISCLVILFDTSLYPQKNLSTFQNYSFENFTSKINLPNSSVTTIKQDYLGYLWLGTQNGLVKYDGFSVKVFQPKNNNLGSISGRGITSIFEDRNKTLWIGTMSGLNKYNHEDGSFEIYQHKFGDSQTLNSDSIQCIYEDSKNRLWIGTTIGLNLMDRDHNLFANFNFVVGTSEASNNIDSKGSFLCVRAITEDPNSGNLFIGTDKNGLWMFNPNKGEFSKYNITNFRNADQKIGWIQSLYKSKTNKLWIASNHSLSSLDLQTGEFKSYIDFSIQSNIYAESSCYMHGSVLEGLDGLIWFGFVWGENGVFCVDPTTGKVYQYKLNKSAAKNTFDNMIFTVFRDRSNIIWAGTLDRGLWKLDERKCRFQFIKHNPEDSNSLSNSYIHDVVYDPRGYMWISTKSALDRYDLKSGQISHFLQNQKYLTSSRYKTEIDRQGNIWIGSEFGLLKFDPDNNTYQLFCNNPKDKINLLKKSIFRMLLDHRGKLWIGTMNFGLYTYDIKKNKLTLYHHNPEDKSSLSGDKIRSIYEDESRTIWIGTNESGLNKYNSKTNDFTHFGLECISPIIEDYLGNFWVTDYFTGLNLVDRTNGKILENYNSSNGLPFTEIAQILGDNNGNLWLGTRKGLSKFDIKKRTFRNYTREDGLPDETFLAYHPAKDSRGRMYFITSKGLLIFQPDEVKDDSIPPQIVLSNVSLFNRPNNNNSLGFSPVSKELILPYNYNDLRFDYIGLQYSEPSNNKYKYKLENFDNDWIEAGTQRNATYTNLDPGEYVFKVMASNSDGVWNYQPASIKIIITPPWWFTTWAYLMYFLTILLITYVTWKLQLKRIRLKQEVEMSKFEAQKLLEVDGVKTRFFTNISHEFRTPLTLIQGPAKHLIKESKEIKTRDGAKIIYRNALKLTRLVNQLLDLSKLEAGKMSIRASETNVVNFIKDIVLSFTPLAEKKRITLEFNYKNDAILAFIDKDGMSKIISNIISNAFKFTPNCGKINVSAVKNDKSVLIKISDTGIGIPKERINKIFDRFYQVDDTQTREQEGTGIGLALTKELIELHKGSIEVESKEGEGSTFIISIPLGKEHFKSEQILNIDDNKDSGSSQRKEYFELYETENNKSDLENIESSEKPVLLIVEDNTDVRYFIRNIFEYEYTIFEAKDGEEGLRISLKEIPDLIISDLMMPKLDGFAMCAKIKTDERTSHIPLIMLTAKATNKDLIEGLETGADDYIMKPFDADVLKTRVKNLFEQRKRLKDHFIKNGIIQEEFKQVTKYDKVFIQKIIKIINDHLSNSELSVEFLANEIAMSRVTLHKKLNSLIGESPSDLIKRIRLNKASKYLQNNQGNISEIAIEVGFNNPAYFAECFKKQFGISPSQYQHKFTNH